MVCFFYTVRHIHKLKRLHILLCPYCHHPLLLYPSGAVDLPPFSRFYLKERGVRSLAVTFCHERCKRRHTSGCLRKHSSPLRCVDRVGEQSVRISHLPGDLPLHLALPALPPSYSDSKLSPFAVGLPQPWLPLPHGSGRKKAPPRHPDADGAAFFTRKAYSEV